MVDECLKTDCQTTNITCSSRRINTNRSNSGFANAEGVKLTQKVFAQEGES